MSDFVRCLLEFTVSNECSKVWLESVVEFILIKDIANDTNN